MAAIDAATFWDAPTKNPTGVGEDGAQWIIEGISARQVSRWSSGGVPDRTQFALQARHFWRAAHLSFPADEMY